MRGDTSCNYKLQNQGENKCGKPHYGLQPEEIGLCSCSATWPILQQSLRPGCNKDNGWICKHNLLEGNILYGYTRTMGCWKL